MVEIRKGDRVLSVPAGAVKKYTSAGWIVKVSKSEKKVSKDKELSSKENEALAGDHTQDDGEWDDSDYEDAAEDEDYVDPEELAARPLEELSTEELRILAEYKGIDVTELRSAKKLRAAIAALE